MVKIRAIYPGTFDPVTNGHVDVIERALKLFDAVIVAVAEKPGKKTLFSVDERIAMAKRSLKGKKGIIIKRLDGLLVDFARKEKCTVIIKGLRELSDFQYEFQQAIVNRKLYPEIETVLIMTNPRYFYISSSIVKEISSLGGNVEKFAPKHVQDALKRKAKENMAKTGEKQIQNI